MKGVVRAWGKIREPNPDNGGQVLERPKPVTLAMGNVS